MFTSSIAATGPHRTHSVVPDDGVLASTRAALTPDALAHSPSPREAPGQKHVPLPDPAGARAQDPEVRAAVQGLLGADDDVAGFVVYELLQRVAQRGLETQRALQRGAQSTLNIAKRQEAGHTLDQVLGQNKSAKVNATGMISGSLLTLAGVVLGASGEQRFLGQFAYQATQALQPMISVVDRSSATLGGSYHANLATLAIKDDAIDTQGGSAALEAARAAVETNQERLKSAAEFVSSYLQRRADVLDRMAH